MRNVTISMDDELHRNTRLEAARAGKSVSRYIADSLRYVQADGAGRGGRDRNLQLEALERMLQRRPLHIAAGGRMPTADERNER